MGLFNLFPDRVAEDIPLLPPDNQEILDKFKYTPDIYKLDKYEDQFVFIADELMKCFELHNNFLQDAQYYGTAYTQNSFSVFRHKIPGKIHPVILPDKFLTNRHCRVKGELYLCKYPSVSLPKMDTYKQNGEVFQRLRVRLIQPVKRLVGPRELFDNRKLYFSEGMWYNIPKLLLCKHPAITVRAWMYIAVPSYWNALLDGGYSFSPVKTYLSRDANIGEYYFFTRGETTST